MHHPYIFLHHSYMHTYTQPLPNASSKDRSGEEQERPANVFQRCYRSYFADTGDSYVDTLLAANTVIRAARFFPALFITVCSHSLLTIILMMFTFSVVLASSSSHHFIFISLLSLLCNTLILQFAIELGNTVVLGRIHLKKIYDKDILSLIERRTSGYALKPFHIGAVHSSHKCYCWKHRPADLLFSYILS